MPYRYFIHLSFHGAAYSGWQIQPNAPSVQGLIEAGLSNLLREEVSVTGCGRTDSGVHARFFAAHFETEQALNDLQKFAYRLDRFLPPEIAIHTVKAVTAGAHARFSALWREYQYTITLKKDPFRTDTAWLLPWKLDIDKMNLGASILLKHSDFECFSKVNTDVKSFRCQLIQAKWIQNGDLLVFTIRADRFLRNMVRAIVGTLVDMGRGKTDIKDLEAILLSHDRRKAGSSVPARGLALNNVGYDPGIYAIEPVRFSEQRSEKIEPHDSNNAQFHYGSGKEADE
jgi:tRNA pseudouridine38-40 synthase